MSTSSAPASLIPAARPLPPAQRTREPRSASIVRHAASPSGEPTSVYVCPCKACQRRTGAIIHNGSSWQKEKVRVEGEQPKDQIAAEIARVVAERLGL